MLHIFQACPGPVWIYTQSKPVRDHSLFMTGGAWAGKIQLITKQNVLTHPLHHKKIQ